ncbi:MAG: AAA family ATPase [Pseudomonadota bacterium]|nr:AAA family ATPase [Pseudomonadota bacterium]
MRLKSVRISNFRSCRDVSLEICGMHALVGANNAGKSSVLRALDFLFNPSTKNLNEESFWNKDTSLEIRVEAQFSDLSDAERESLDACLQEDGTFYMGRSARMDEADSDSSQDGEQAQGKITIGQHYRKSVPEPEWLRESEINGKRIAVWWKSKGDLTIDGIDFVAFLASDKKPAVGEWKTKAQEFVDVHRADIPFKNDWIDNPQGYANVLKGTLPFFVLVPAVRDVSEESKATKSSPFGKLLSALLGSIEPDQRNAVEGMLNKVASQMNRVGGAARIPLISDTETRLNALLSDFFAECDLEIEFETPSLETILGTPRLFVDDGFRTAVENKGHGLQRAVIFTILRRYADHMTAVAEGKKRNLILAVEEPELYMHPQAQRTVRGVFTKIKEAGDQVFFTTHSSLQVDVAYFDEIIRLERQTEIVDDKKTVVSKVAQLPMHRMISDLESRLPNLKGKVTADSMRDLYSHAYNPRRSEGFFASKIILVEGLTEEYSLPIYAQAIPGCSFDLLGISVVECGGKGSMDRLYRIFNELRIPCYMLFDYDRGNTNNKIIEKSKELLAFADIETDAPQGVLIGDQVACFEETWEKGLKPEVPDWENLALAAKRKLGLTSDSGKPLIARYIARKLVERPEPFVPPTIRAIIDKARAVTWSKSCLHTDAGDNGGGS